MNPVTDRSRTFSLDIGSDGAASLQKAILAKLSEFMGDYTDDILAQYILVLVAHGKHQDQAAKELEAFLGDQSEAFVSWLWDYLSSNIQLLTSPPKKINSECTAKEMTKASAADVQESLLDNCHEKTKKHTEIPSKDSKSTSKGNKENREDRSGCLENNNHGADERHGGHRSAKRQRSPQNSRTYNERKASDTEHHYKRHLSPPRVNATRRLLQSAVRDAVAPVASLTKSGSKRLRSVVATEIEHSETLEIPSRQQPYQDPGKIDDIRQTVKHVSSTSMEPASPEDMSKSRTHTVGSVWNRLGKLAEDGKAQTLEKRRNSYPSRELHNNRIQCEDNFSDERLQLKTGSRKDEKLPSVFSRVGEWHESRIGNLKNEGVSMNDLRAYNNNLKPKDRADKDHSESTFERCKAARNIDQTMTEAKKVLNSQANSELHHSCQKVLNTSVGVNTWKSQACKPHCDEAGISENAVASQVQASKTLDTGSPHAQAASDPGQVNDSPKDILELKDRLLKVQDEMTKLRAKQVQAKCGTEQSQKANDGSIKPTVFVTNIHFAATKDSVMSHFAQCGEIEDVIMLMDPTTGQPKGAAYILFHSTSAVEKALAMNDTSFYSRLLKVVRKESIEIPEVSSLSPSAARQTNLLPMRGSVKTKFLRGIPYSLPRLSNTPRRFVNPTNLQWRRESTLTSSANSSVNVNKQAHFSQSPTLNTARSFSYIRNVSTNNTGGIHETPAVAMQKGDESKVNGVKAT